MSDFAPLPPGVSTLDLSALTGHNGFRLDGASSQDSCGARVSSAGDINGDGFDDLIIGARQAGGDTNPGASYVVFGKSSDFAATLDLSTLDGSNGFRLDGVGNGDQSGNAVRDAGDVNGDGFDDLIIGAYLADVGGWTSGASYVVFGKSGGFASSLNLSTLNGSNGFRLDGVAAYDGSGRSVSSAGDVNGDGFDDLIVGAAGANTDDTGASYVVFGQASGFASTLDLSTLNGSNGFRLDGVSAGSGNGGAVSSAGDVNGDGLHDLLVGAQGAGVGGTYSGASYVVFGQTSGFAASLDLSTLDGSNGFRLDGVGGYDRSGSALSSAGDVNGDGFDDFIIGAWAATVGVSRPGASYVVFGKASGFASILDLSTLNGSNGFRLAGFAGNDQSGRSVRGAGDVNGDGFDDLIIGSPGTNVSANGSTFYDAGVSYVLFGQASAFASSLNLSTLNGTNGFRLNGANGVDLSGESVSSAGDVNGDGFDDLIVGAPWADVGGDESGASYVVFGGNYTNLSTAAQSCVGTTGTDTLRGGLGDDILVGNGGADLLIGGHGDDTLTIPDGNFLRLDAGGGQDTLRLVGEGMTLDLTDSSLRNRVQGIEIIDLQAGSGSHTLILDFQQVSQLLAQGTTLRVMGDAEDLVDLGSGWTLQGQQTIGGELYNQFVQYGSTLLLDADTASIYLATLSAPDFSAGDDTGASDSDDITRNTSGLTLSGIGQALATVTLFDDANGNDTLDAGELLGHAAVSDNRWSLDVSLALGTYAIKAFQGIDNTSSPVSVPLTLTIIPDIAPLVANPIPDQVINNTGRNFSYIIPANTFSDEERDALTYSALLATGNSLPWWLTLNGNIFLGTAPENTCESLSVHVIADDGYGGTVTDDFDFTVDTIAPTGSLTLPDDGIFDSDLSSFVGTAGDVGMGVRQVATTIQNQAGQYLGLQGYVLKWQTAPFFFTASSENGWNDWSLELGSLFPSGRLYTATTRVIDQAGNVTLTPTDFGVTESGDPYATRIVLEQSLYTRNPGQSLTLNGQLLQNEGVALNRVGLEVMLTITVPDTPIRTVTTTTTDSTGHFSFVDLDGLVSDALLEVTASGSLMLAPPTPAQADLHLGEPAGYAILVQGELDTNSGTPEGIEAHKRTTNRIYETLLRRGFSTENIQYFNYDTHTLGPAPTSDNPADYRNLPGVAPNPPTLASLQEAIENWAYDRLIAQPAPLYVILVDHGSRETFYLGPDEQLTAASLAAWMNRLDSRLGSESAGAAGQLALAQQQMMILGACYSGSFIDALSRPGRTLITTASANEKSHRGAPESDGIQVGELFLQHFFQFLGAGASFHTAFTQATELTENDPVVLANADNSRFNTPEQRVQEWLTDRSGQHPLLDDNGDGAGSNALSTTHDQDGAAAAALHLGFTRSSLTNSLLDPVQIAAVTPSQQILSGATLTLWATESTPDGRFEASQGHVTVVVPGVDPADGETPYQVSLDLPRSALTRGTNGRWEIASTAITGFRGFTAPGHYQFQFTLQDGESDQLSTPRVAHLYVNQAGNHNPASPLPETTSRVEAIGLFNWSDVTDPDGDRVRYTLVIARDSAFTQELYRQESLETSLALVNFQDLLAQGEYWWRIEASDPYGGVAISDPQNFTLVFPNDLPAILYGILYSNQDYAALQSAMITLNQRTLSPEKDGTLTLLLPGHETTRITVTQPGFRERTLTVTPDGPGTVVRQWIGLTPESTPSTPDNPPPPVPDPVTPPVIPAVQPAPEPVIQPWPDLPLGRFLAGTTGNDTLTARTGIDVLVGYQGDDTYIVDRVDLDLKERVGEGVDTVQSFRSWRLGAQLENLVLIGPDAREGTGNSLANRITGNEADNRLDGAFGADTLIGGSGDDHYRVDDLRDRVIERSSEGVDRIVSSVSFMLPAQVEQLMLTGTAPLQGTGNELANLLIGNAGANRLSGGAGDDLYYVGAGDAIFENPGEGIDQVRTAGSWTLGDHLENLTLIGTNPTHAIGNRGDNRLIGNRSDNLLDGEAGADILIGGAGDDLYRVEDPRDRVIERADQGNDLVMSSISCTLPAQVEKLTLTGTNPISGTGNRLANHLIGNGAANILSGGAGDDLYEVDAGDTVIEGRNQGSDTVSSRATWQLGANLEQLILTGSAAINGFGNDLANTLTGNSGDNLLDGGGGADLLTGGLGNDRLQGGVGADWLTGGPGADRFQWHDPSEGGDTLTDFNPRQGDRLGFFSPNFGDLSVGQVASDRFLASVTALPTTPLQRFLFNTRTRTLHYDPDGIGPMTASLLVTLHPGATLSHHYLLMVSE
ncbi:MAG: FG-GAP repeat protein [Magnetococcales bacterium]|nr:FG-GAP repeat protein [Magnetococcales bacterium]